VFLSRVLRVLRSESVSDMAAHILFLTLFVYLEILMNMKKILFIVLINLLSLTARAGLGVAPFIETQNEFTDGILGSEITVTHQGKSQTYPLVINETASGEKFKFTIADGNPEGEVYVTVFEEPGSVEGSFKSIVSNPAVTIPALKDVLGYCLIEQ
jgi:hypothetical protein